MLLRAAGDADGSVAAAARASWYEARANNPEVVADAHTLHKAAEQDEQSYQDQLFEQRGPSKRRRGRRWPR